MGTSPEKEENNTQYNSNTYPINNANKNDTSQNDIIPVSQFKGDKKMFSRTYISPRRLRHSYQEKRKKNLENEINNAYYKAKQAIQFTKDAELQNKDIIAKIKAINEQKNEIEKKLKQDYEETKAQCDKFKEEYKKKFDEVSNEALIKENEDLAKKVQETKENSANIKKNINERILCGICL